MNKHTQFLLTIGACLCLLVIASCSRNTELKSILDSADQRFMNKEFDAAQADLLKAESLITDDTPLSDKERLERIKGMNYLELKVMDKAKGSLQRALDYSVQMGDTSRIIQNSFNLGLCDNTVDEVIHIYESVIELAEKGEPVLLAQALEKLSQGYIYNKDFDKAQGVLDRASGLIGNNSPMSQQIEFTQYELWLAENNLEMALSGFKSIPADSCSMVGKLVRSQNICRILYELGDYKGALAYKDSIQQFTDSIKSIDGANRMERIEEDYKQTVKDEKTRFNILLYSFLSALIVIVTIMYFVFKNLRLKHKQLFLINKISELNVKLSALQPEEEPGENSNELIDPADVQSLIMEKYTLSLEMFKTQPQFTLLKKLNLIREFDTVDKEEIKEVSSEIIGRFSDACSSLRQTVPAMTNDDCLMCSMAYCGCSKEIISAIMGSSEEAVRRRKSRVKQKLPESLFSFFFK